MSKVTAGNFIAYNTGNVLNPGQRVEYIQSADPADMEARVNALLAELAAEAPDRQWEISFIGIAGAGDGHTFVTELRFFDNAAAGISGDGIELSTSPTRVFFYMAADARELPQHRALAQKRAADFADSDDADAPFQHQQSLTHGASQGLRRMGAELFTYAAP